MKITWSKKIVLTGILCFILIRPGFSFENQQPVISGRGSGTAYAFLFFWQGGEANGMCAAVSRDGLTWKICNSGEPILAKPFGKVFRDPAVSQSADGIYHMVWTLDWGGSSSTKIGYACSKDLIHWTDMRQLDLMGSVQGTVNVWAPELFFDQENSRWMIYWASSVEGRFQETESLGKKSANNRMYFSFTRDFQNFTEPQLLFSDHIVNDTRIINTDSPHGKYCMITKHITIPGKQAKLYLTFSDKVNGPYKPSEKGYVYISDPYQFCEGPAVIKIDNSFYCYFELSRERRMACKRNREIKPEGWEDVTDELSFPCDVKHGDIIRIPYEIYEELSELRGLCN